MIRALGARLRGAVAGWTRRVRRIWFRDIVTETVIAAEPAEVWHVLTEFAAYPAWNSFITSVLGEARPGTRLRAVAVPPYGPGMRFRAVVTAAEPGVELRWTGVLLFAWLFHGRHYFELERLPGDPPRTLLRQGETIGGLLNPLIGVLMSAWMTPGFAKMNRALKERAEAAQSRPLG